MEHYFDQLRAQSFPVCQELTFSDQSLHVKVGNWREGVRLIDGNWEYLGFLCNYLGKSRVEVVHGDPAKSPLRLEVSNSTTPPDATPPSESAPQRSPASPRPDQTLVLLKALFGTQMNRLDQ